MEQVAPPDPVPGAYAADVSSLSRDLQLCFNMYSVPYFIQAQFAKERCTTMADLACRWDTPEKARALAPDELDFKDGKNNFDAKTSRHAAMRFFQAVNDAKVRYDKSMKEVSSASGLTEEPVSLQPGQRAVLEDAYRKRLGLTTGPPLEDQGSDSFLAAQLAYCKKGEIGHFPVKKIVSAIPDPEEAPYLTKRRRRDMEGYMREHDEEERQNPQNLRQWESMLRVFQTNLLMSVWAYPQFAKLAIDKEDLDRFYRFVLGSSIAHRSPAPSVTVLMIAERKAWREVVLSMHRGATLKQALSDIQADSLFWQREVYERVQRDTYQGAPGPKGKGKFREGKSRNKERFQRQPYPIRDMGRDPKGKGKNKSKSAGKGKNKGARWPSNWATKDPGGKDYCRNFLLTGKCSGQCGRSHKCPVMKSDNWICNENHFPEQCPHMRQN